MSCRVRRPGGPRAALALLSALATLLAVLAVSGPAAAHQADPRVSATVDEIDPALPADVVVQAQAGLASQLVVANPTATVLDVLATTGEPFLRISSAGVLANLSSRDFFTTSNPNGAAAGAPAAGQAAPPRWVQVSRGSSWGWYDHRLHPPGLDAPADDRREVRLAQWTVPLQYGGRPVEVRGAVLFRPLLGSFLVTADPAPEGLVVQALPGKLPGLFLSNPERLPVTVLGRDGEPFVRFGDRGVEVNVVSRTHVEDRQARGMPAGPPGPVPRFELVAPGATSYTWLDARLRYPQETPPADVLQAQGPTVVDEWQVPLTGATTGQAALTGDVQWVPRADVPAGAPQEQSQEQSQDASQQEPAADAPTRGLPLLLAGGALVLLGGVLAARRRSR